MRIAFVNPPYKFAFSRASRWPEVTKSGTIYYPLFLCYAAAVAEKAKHEIFVLDSIARKLDFDMTIQTIDKFKPNMIVVESSTPSIKNDVAFVEQYKKDNPTVKVVLVGTHPSALPDETMKMSKFIDFIARHEYDATIIDLANAVGGHKKYSQVDGLVYRDTTGKVVMNKSRELIKNLDEIPFVSEIYNKFLNIEDYRYALAQHPMIQVVSSRGCPNFCTFCLTKTTPVITDHGPVLISDIFERAKGSNDIRHQDLSGIIYNYNKTNVMTHLGEFLPTKYATTNYYSGGIASIKARGMPEIQLTEGHKIFAVRREDIANCIYNRDMYCRGYHDNCGVCKSKQFLKYNKQVIQAKDIRKGDYLVAPIPKLKKSYQKYINVITLFDKFSKNKPKKYSMHDEQMLNKVYALHNQGVSTRKIAKLLHMSKSNVHYRIKTRNDISKIILKTDKKYAWFSGGKTKIPKKILLDAEIFKLAGYYLAEGCTSQQKNRPNTAYISFTFNKNEKNYISDVSDIIFKKFGLRPKLVNNEQNNTIQITVYSNILALLFERLFGSNCLNKNIHETFLIGNAELLKQLISGVFRGDGHVSKKSVALSTASSKMMSQIVNILFYLGIVPTIVVQDPERRNKAKNIQYLISVWGNDLRKIENITNMHTNHHGNYTETIRTNDEILLKVTNVKIESYEGQVYNLGVEKAESYTPWFVEVKNCLYPQTLMGRAFRPRSADNFVKELVWVKNNMKVKEIFIEDDTFTVDRQRVLDICRLMKENDMSIPWSCNCRADVPLEVLKAMKEAGCRMVIVGYECLDGDTIIFLPDGTMKKIFECQVPLISVNFDNMNIVSSVGTKIVKPGKFKMIKLETGTREIVSSPTHKFFILTENGIEEKQAKDIDTNDYLATIKKIDIEGKHLLKKDIAEFLGYYTGDGTCDIEDKIKYKKKYRVRLFDEHLPILEYYQKIIRKEWGTVAGINKDKSKNNYTLTANSKTMTNWLKELGLKCYSNKRIVPDIVCKCSNEELAGYLRGIFDAEGSVSLEPTTLALRFTSSSKDLITQIKWLLLRFGIESTKVKMSKNKFGLWYYILIKRRDSVELFEKHIGFNHHERSKKLKKLLGILNKRPFRRYQSDVVPYQILKTIIKELTIGKGFTSPYSKIRARLAQRISGKQNISKKLLADILQELKELGVERDYPNLIKHVELLKNLIGSKIGWERVWKKTNTVAKNIYDFSIPKHNNYIANGFIVHNSGNQAILNTIKKGINIEMAEEFTSNAKEAKLKIFGCFMIGLPGETKETIEETFKFARRLSPDMVFFQQAIPFPGTEFYTWAKLNKYITANAWEEWLDKNGQLDCIVSYPNLSNKEICKLKDKLMIRYYASPKHIIHTIKHNFNTGEMKRLGKASTQFLKYLVKRRIK